MRSRATGTALGATYSAVRGDGDLHAGWPRYAAVGVEQRLPILRFLTVRGGYATSLEGAAAVTGGIGIGLGSLNLTAAAILSTGHGDENAGPEPDRQRFANQLEAGSGFAVYVGLDILRF